MPAILDTHCYSVRYCAGFLGRRTYNYHRVWRTLSPEHRDRGRLAESSWRDTDELVLERWDFPRQIKHAGERSRRRKSTEEWFFPCVSVCVCEDIITSATTPLRQFWMRSHACWDVRSSFFRKQRYQQFLKQGNVMFWSVFEPSLWSRIENWEKWDEIRGYLL